MDEFNQAILLEMYAGSLVNCAKKNKMLQFSADGESKLIMSNLSQIE